MKKNGRPRLFLIIFILFWLATFLPAIVGGHIPLVRFFVAGALVSTAIYTGLILGKSSFNQYKALLIYFPIMALCGLPYILSDFSQTNIPLDYAAYFFLLIGVGWYTLEERVLVRFWGGILLCSILVFFLTGEYAYLGMAAYDDFGIAYESFSTITYWVGFVTIIPPLLIFFDIKGLYEKYQLAFLLFIVFGVIVALIAQKRSLIVAVVFTLFYVFFLRGGKSKHIGKSVLIILAVLFVLYNLVRIVGSDVIDILWGHLEGRFKDTADDVQQFDRLVEFKDWVKSAGFFQIIFGCGLGSYQDVLGFSNYHLHIGWFNLIFKGGIVFLVLIIYCIYNNIRLCLTHWRDSITNKRIFWLNIWLILHLLHSPLWGYYMDGWFLGIVICSYYGIVRFSVPNNV